MSDTLFEVEPICQQCGGTKRVWNAAAGEYGVCPSCARRDAQKGTELKREAIARVNEHASEEWMEAARTAVRALARALPSLTTDDVWREVERTGMSTHEPRAMGAVMTRMARDRVIVSTNVTVESARPENHRRPIRVWRSLVFREETL